MSQPEVIDTISSALSESAEEPMRLIREIVEELGGDAALALLAETRRVEEAGGLVVARGNRRRSPGGVFFKLAKDRLPKEARKRIFRSPQNEKSPDSGAPDESPSVADATAERPASPSPPRVPVRPAQPPAPPPRPQPPAPRGMPEVVVTRRRIIASPPQASASPPGRPMSGSSPRPVAGPANVVDFRRERSPYDHPPREHAASEEPRRPNPPVRERVLVRVAPQSDVPAKTLDEAIDRVGRVLSELDDKTARAALLEMIDRKGGLPVPEEEPESEPAPAPEPQIDVEALKQSILVRVVRALGLEARDLATVLYGDDSPGARRKARTLLGADDD